VSKKIEKVSKLYGSMSQKQVAKKTGISLSYIRTIASRKNLKRQGRYWNKEDINRLKVFFKNIESIEKDDYKELS
jgi:transposase